MIFMFAGLLLAIVGYLIKYRHVYWLIKGYLLMPQESRDTYNLDELSSFIGMLHLILSPLFLFTGIWILLELPGSNQLIYAVLTLSVLIALWATIHCRRSERFRRR